MRRNVSQRTGAEIDRGMQQRARDALERQKDRQDHEGQVDHRHGDQHGALVEEEELARLFENAEADQHLAERPLSPSMERNV